MERYECYHGTIRERAENILAKNFNKSTKNNEWLGWGVYFFDKVSAARSWAILERNKQPRKTQAAVLTVSILFEIGSFLDLDKPDIMKRFRMDLSDLNKGLCSGAGGAPRFKDDCERRCFYCNYYLKFHDTIKILAYSFPKIAYDKFGFPQELLHRSRQLCVVDKRCIEMSSAKMEVLS